MDDTTYPDLRNLFSGGRSSDRCVVESENREVSREPFQRRVADLKRTLEEHSCEQWVLSCERGFPFAVGLFAIWLSGGHVVLPPNDKPETLTRLLKGNRGMISDQPDRRKRTSVSVDPLGGTAPAETPEGLKDVTGELTLFTSGSTGDPQPVSKTIDDFTREIECLETLWGRELGDARVVSTASHQHIYALIHKVLWPLAAGRSFVSESVYFPEAVIATLRRGQAAVLVTTPSHLETLVQYEGFSDAKNELTAVFSSGGPLPRTVAERVRDKLGFAPYEIYGSTETGGIAWRQRRSESETPWKTFDPVEGSESSEGTLLVNSPWCSEGTANGFDTRDRVRFEGKERFFLGGRADRVENIAENRVDLSEYETHLERHEAVSEAGAIVAETTDGTGSRRTLRVVVVPAPEEDGSENEIKSVVRDHLKELYPSVLLPADIRVRDRLPRNSEGKVTEGQLRPVFEDE